MRTRARRSLGWCVALVAGCASTVTAPAGDAGLAPVDDDVPVSDVAGPDGPHVVDLSISSVGHQCARMSDGTVRCRGSNDDGQLGLGTSDLDGSGPTGAVAVPGLTNSCALLADRTVTCWGDGRYHALGVEPPDRCANARGGVDLPCATRPTPVPGLDRVDRLFVGRWGGCALRLDRSVWCWGSLSADSVTGAPTPVAW